MAAKNDIPPAINENSRCFAFLWKLNPNATAPHTAVAMPEGYVSIKSKLITSAVPTTAGSDDPLAVVPMATDNTSSPVVSRKNTIAIIEKIKARRLFRVSEFAVLSFSILDPYFFTQKEDNRCYNHRHQKLYDRYDAFFLEHCLCPSGICGIVFVI